MRILIRADAASHIGTGHVFRCLSLAKALRALGADVEFVTKRFDYSTDDDFSHYGFRVHVFDAPDKASFDLCNPSAAKHAHWLHESELHDFNRMQSVLVGSHYDWLIVDSYSLSIVWEEQCAVIADKILVIDDLADRQHSCDLLLDQNIKTSVQSRHQCLVKEGTRLLLGPKYSLLRPEFALETRDFVPLVERKVPRLLLFFGGADKTGLTYRTLETFGSSDLMNSYQIAALVGPANSDAGKIHDFCQRHDFCTYFSDVEDMAVFLSGFDFAIAACGFICYELAAMRIPSILVPVSRIQTTVAFALQEAGIAKVLEPDWLFDSNVIGTSLSDLYEITEQDFAQFPKDGAESVAQELLRF